MNKVKAQELIDKKDFTKYSFEYLDGYVDAIIYFENLIDNSIASIEDNMCWYDYSDKILCYEMIEELKK